MTYLNLNNHITTTGYIIKPNEEIINIDLEFDIAGYLKSGVVSPYLNDNDPGYIIVPYDILKKYYDNSNCCGYTIFFNSYNQMTLALENITIPDTFINSNFQNTIVINKMLNKIHLHSFFISSLFLIVLGLQSIIAQLWLYKCRNYELAILHVNGLSKKDILTIIKQNNRLISIITFISSLFLLVIMMIVNGNLVLKLYAISFIFSIIVIVIINIILKYQIIHLKPTNIIRN